MTRSQPTLRELALRVQQLTEQVVMYYDEAKLGVPTFHPDSAPVPENPVYDGMRASLSEAMSDLALLINGPKDFIRTALCSHCDLSAYQVALDFDFFCIVPSRDDRSISTEDLASQAGMDEDRTRRVMRFLASQRMFIEVELDQWRHTSISMVLATDPEIKAAAQMEMDEYFQAASETAASIRRAPYKTDLANSPFSVRHGVPVFEFYKQNLQKANRFAKAMVGIAKFDRQTSELKDLFPWNAIEAGKVVDIGGGNGHVSVELAQAFPHLEYIVQDSSPDMIAQGQRFLPESVAQRVEFMQHDFFQPQPIDGASAYFIRQCIHNWNDQDACKILKAIVPALENSNNRTPLLINDTVLPVSGAITRLQEHAIRQMDMLMLIFMGAKQRNVEEFEALLKSADKRYKIARVHATGPMGLLEVHLQSQQDE